MKTLYQVTLLMLLGFGCSETRSSSEAPQNSPVQGELINAGKAIGSKPVGEALTSCVEKNQFKSTTDIPAIKALDLNGNGMIFSDDVIAMRDIKQASFSKVLTVYAALLEAIAKYSSAPELACLDLNGDGGLGKDDVAQIKTFFNSIEAPLALDRLQAINDLLTACVVKSQFPFSSDAIEFKMFNLNSDSVLNYDDIAVIRDIQKASLEVIKLTKSAYSSAYRIASGTKNTFECLDLDRNHAVDDKDVEQMNSFFEDLISKANTIPDEVVHNKIVACAEKNQFKDLAQIPSLKVFDFDGNGSIFSDDVIKLRDISSSKFESLVKTRIAFKTAFEQSSSVGELSCLDVNGSGAVDSEDAKLSNKFFESLKMTPDPGFLNRMNASLTACVTKNQFKNLTLIPALRAFDFDKSNSIFSNDVITMRDIRTLDPVKVATVSTSILSAIDNHASLQELSCLDVDANNQVNLIDRELVAAFFNSIK